MVGAVAVGVAVAELAVGSLAVFSPGVTITTGRKEGGGQGVVTRGTSFYNKGASRLSCCLNLLHLGHRPEKRKLRYKSNH